jgi:hypothetical protein
MLPSEFYTDLGLADATQTVNYKHFATSGSNRMLSLTKEEVFELRHVFITLYKVIDRWNAFEAEWNQMFSLMTTCQRQIMSGEWRSYSQDQAFPPPEH